MGRHWQEAKLMAEKEKEYWKLSKWYRKNTQMPYALASAAAAKKVNGGRMPKTNWFGEYVWDI